MSLGGRHEWVGAAAGRGTDEVKAIVSSTPEKSVEPTAEGQPGPRVLGRVQTWNEQRVNLDGFAEADSAIGLIALDGEFDRRPSLALDDNGVVVELDGVKRDEFDIIDAYLASHAIDARVADEAMAVNDLDFARSLVDPGVPRPEITRLVGGMTPAKLTRCVAHLRPIELLMAISKMRVRRTPSVQAHVTNRLDDPLLLAADSATAVALGFREVETTVPVLGDAASNAIAVLIGSQVPAPGALAQCSIEEALELDLGLRGLTSYAETVSLYGTEQVFIDGDDTPWSKAFLCSAYASRGLKMRVTSGGGAEVLMGEAEKQSMLQLESRCVALARAIGAQGVQNGGIDGASVVASVPDGMRGLLLENLMVMARDLESCSGNDALISESDLRRAAHTVPLLLAGSDFLFSGFGSTLRYDNMFGPSNFNGEDIDDYLVFQRDWCVDGGLAPVDETVLEAVRRRAASAVRDVYRDLDLYEYSDERIQSVVYASGSKDLPEGDPLAPLDAATAILERGITAVDVAASLARTGYPDEAERVLGMARERVKGDYLQTAAIFDTDMRVLSKVTDPNDYRGPGTGYEMSDDRRAKVIAVRQQRSIDDLLAEQASAADHLRLIEVRESVTGDDPREVCIGVSPAFARTLWVAMSGLRVGEVLREILAGLEEEGCRSRIVRVKSTIDAGLIGLTAAQLAGSGIGIGLQAKGTSVIHRRGLAPLACLELYSIAPLVTREMYRRLGMNAGRHAKGLRPVPVMNPYTEMAIEARFHAKTVAMVNLERSQVRPGPPADLERDVR